MDVCDNHRKDYLTNFRRSNQLGCPGRDIWAEEDMRLVRDWRVRKECKKKKKNLKVHHQKVHNRVKGYRRCGYVKK